MIIAEPIPGVLQIVFNSQIEQAVSMARMSEYFESNNPAIKGNVFSWSDFLLAYLPIKYEDNFSYFDYFEGFNIPSAVVNEFFTNFDLSCQEKQVQEKWCAKTYQYIITSYKNADKTVLQHELAHAKYALDNTYKETVDKIIGMIPPLELSKMIASLSAIGYIDDNFFDEIQAYIITSTHEELETTFPTVPITELLFHRINFLKELKKINGRPITPSDWKGAVPVLTTRLRKVA